MVGLFDGYGHEQVLPAAHEQQERCSLFLGIAFDKPLLHTVRGAGYSLRESE